MCRKFVLLLAAATLGLASGAQSTSTASPPADTSPALHASPRSIVLSVVVEDRESHPIRGLKAKNFRVTEGGVPQTIARMEEHSSQVSSLPTPPFPSLPPGTFTNYTPIAPGETLNILVIDALNTPLKGEGFIRSQLLQYVRHANPNTRIAVLGLANRLILLQGFTSDPSALRDVVERKLIARSPTSPASPEADQHGVPTPSKHSSSVASPAAKGSQSAVNLAANLRAFEGEFDSLETDFRVQYTLDAFNTLAHYLGAFPGRKNVIWFSGSFPLNIVPDPSLQHPFDVANTDADELRETVNLLSNAQVAVYPVDARSLIASSASKATNANHVRSFSFDLSKVKQSQAAEHAMMEAIAASTGGRTFYNPESVADAVDSAVAAGSNYYTLTYSSTNTEADGSYRPVHVDTIGVDAKQPLRLSYRRGDYSDNAAAHHANESQNSSASTPEQSRAAAYAHAAMSRGGPTPEDLVFRVRVLPASATTETVLAPGNELAPVVPSNGPFRRYDLDFLALPGELTFALEPDGHRIAKVDFLAYVFDTEGRLLGTGGRRITLEPKTNDASKVARSLIGLHLEVSVPDRAETFLRIGMRDVTSNRFGVIEIPTSAVTSLPPATYAPAVPTKFQPSPAPANPAGRPTPPEV